MTGFLRVIGIDPGPVPGIAVLAFANDRMVTPNIFQCNAAALPDLVAWAIKETPPDWRLVVQTEKFVVGARSARSSSAGAGQATRDLIGELKRVTSGACHMVQRNAGQVKPWATDARLEAAGLLPLTKAVGRHSVDAARHALFCAVQDGGIPDPLSKKWSAT